jgi:hypothetical protein
MSYFNESKLKKQGVVVNMAPKWNGRELTTIVTIGEKKFKTNMGLSNGGSEKQAYVLGNEGWSYFLSLGEIGLSNISISKAVGEYEVSYVSSESERKAWAEYATQKMVEEIASIFAS